MLFKRFLSSLLCILFLLSFFVSDAFSQRITVQVTRPTGEAIQGMIVTVNARLHKYGENVIITQSKTGWTDKEGKVTLALLQKGLQRQSFYNT